MKPLARADASVLAIIAAFTAWRLLLAALVGLGVDETYTVSVAHDLNLSYYDHPPLQYWIVHAFLPLLGDGRAARLPFIVLFAGSCWLLYRLTAVLFGARAGVIAVLALNCAGFFTVAAGGWVLPDGPLLFALLAAALVLARGLFTESASPGPGTWLWAGFWIGVAALAKYHALLFVAGLLLFVLSVPSRRRLLATPGPWLGALLALAVATPVILWNALRGWQPLAFQLGRSRAVGGVHVGLMLLNVAGQAVWMLPWIFVPLLVAFWRAWRTGRVAERSWYCLCLALPAVLVFTVMPLWGHLGLPHWQMPGWVMLFPVLGDYAVRTRSTERLRRWSIVCVGLVIALSGLLTVETATGYGRILVPRVFAYGDPTLDALEWSQLPPELRARGLLGPKTFLITTNWIYAGKIEQALHDTVPVVIFGQNQKQFGLRYDPRRFLGCDAIVVAPADAMDGVPEALGAYFDSVEELRGYALGRSGLPEIELRLLYARNLRTQLPEPGWRYP
jgi:4-amino-4-deoxy-L-arabinose transferase-like glycosyltransferase